MTTVNVNCIIHYKRKDKGSSKLRSRNHSMRGWAEIKCTAVRTWRWCDRVFFFHSSLIKIIHSNCSCLVVGKLQVNARWKYFHAYSQLIYRALHWAYDKLLLYFLFIFFFNAITRQWHDHFWSRIGQNRLKLLSWPKDQAEAVLGSFQLLLCETARRGLAFHISAFMIIVFFFFF